MLRREDRRQQKPSPSGVLKEILLRELQLVPQARVGAEQGARLVRDAAERDTLSALEGLSGIPGLINLFIGAVTELGEQVRTKSTPELTRLLLHDLVDEIDRERIEACRTVWEPILRRLWNDSPELQEELLDRTARHGATLVTSAINEIARQVAGTARPSPHFERFLSALRLELDWNALDEASLVAADHLLDNPQHIAGWLGRLVRRRMGRKIF
jgi:hypothetical protein